MFLTLEVMELDSNLGPTKKPILLYYFMLNSDQVAETPVFIWSQYYKKEVSTGINRIVLKSFVGKDDGITCATVTNQHRHPGFIPGFQQIFRGSSWTVPKGSAV